MLARAAVSAAQRVFRGGLFISVNAFSSISNAGILITILTKLFSKQYV